MQTSHGFLRQRLAGEKFPKGPSKALRTICSRTYSSQWMATQRKSTSHTSFNAVGYVRQVTCRSPRRRQMPCPSKRECLVAWDRSTAGRACKRVSCLQKVQKKPCRAHDCIRATRLPMAKSCFGPTVLEREDLPTSGGLLLPIH